MRDSLPVKGLGTSRSCFQTRVGTAAQVQMGSTQTETKSQAWMEWEIGRGEGTTKTKKTHMLDTRQFEDPGSNMLFLSDLQDHCHESVPSSWAILYKPSCGKSSLFKYLTKLAKPWRTQSTQAKRRN